MFDFDKLVGRIIEKYGTRAAFADAMGMKAGQLTVRLKNKVPFKSPEIEKAAGLLHIKPDDIGRYFFTVKVR